MSFARNGDLKIHMVTHSEEKPHKCKVCDKSFGLLGNLNEHMLTHRAEKHICVEELLHPQ